VIDGKMTAEDLCPACFAAKFPEKSATLKRPWICDYCGGEAQSCESPLDMILAHKYPMKEEFICKSCRATIDHKIESAISKIKEETNDEKIINQEVFKAVEAAYRSARLGRSEGGS
jgi:hypothetical protein